MAGYYLAKKRTERSKILAKKNAFCCTHATWKEISCRDDSVGSAGAQSIWGNGKGFVVSLHPFAGIHRVVTKGIFLSNPPVVDILRFKHLFSSALDNGFFLLSRTCLLLAQLRVKLPLSCITIDKIPLHIVSVNT